MVPLNQVAVPKQSSKVQMVANSGDPYRGCVICVYWGCLCTLPTLLERSPSDRHWKPPGAIGSDEKRRLDVACKFQKGLS